MRCTQILVHILPKVAFHSIFPDVGEDRERQLKRWRDVGEDRERHLKRWREVGGSFTGDIVVSDRSSFFVGMPLQRINNELK